MSNRFLHKVFLLSAFLFSLSNVHAYKLWKGIIEDSTHSALDEDVGIDDTVTVSKDVYIVARHSDVTVTVTRINSIVKPASFYDGDSSTPGWAHVIFRPESPDRTITVDCDFDLTFSGATASSTGPDTDLIVTFSGQGSTIFKLRDINPTWDWRGVQVAFDGYQQGGYAPSSGSVSSITRAGTRVYILMDQTEDQAVIDGINKVVFQRKEYAGSQGYLPVGVKIGNGSFITYLSTNPTGNSGNTGGTAAGGTYDGANGDFGSIAFDPTHADSGRMYLRIARNVESDTAFGDGGMIVLGHFVPHFTEEDIRKNVYLNSVAGRKAIFRIIDDLRYSAAGGNMDDPTEAFARGLLVINECLHVPNMANDPYQNRMIWDASHSDTDHPSYPHYWARDYAWSQAQRNRSGYAPDGFLNVQPGFVLGVNGRMDIYHRVFLDYVASQNQTLNFFQTGDYSTYRGLGYGTELEKASIFKFRNPSAFYVDGLNYYSNINGYFDSGYDNYGIYNPEAGPDFGFINPTAEIFMYGDARTLFRSGKNPETGRCDTSGEDRDAVYGPWYTAGVDRYVYTFTIDKATYDAQYISSSNVTTGEGRNVLDIEGPLTVRRLARNDAPARSYSTVDESNDEAIINLPTVSINETGREYDFENLTDILRPLTKDGSYQIYDSPSVFLNDHIELYNVVYANGDITKPLSVNPSDAYPNFVGGERAYFNETVFSSESSDPQVKEHYQLPNWRIYNSKHALHEHFVASGCRFVVRDQTNYSGTTVSSNVEALYGEDANNVSSLVCYGHGEQLDTLDHSFGRLFMLSCKNNRMSDDSSNSIVESGSINVYRKNKVDSPNLPAKEIKLSLQTDEDDSLIMEPLLEAQYPHHLVLLNRSDNGVGLIDIGWTTTFGDKTRYPWESVSSLSSNYFDINVTTSGDPYEGLTAISPATISIDGNYYYFGGIDAIGNKAVIPVVDDGKGSVVYVRHSGKITVTQPDSTKHGYDVFMDLPIAYKLWSYDGLRGIVDLPKDQVKYGSGFGRQAYNLNTVSTDAGSPIGVHLDTYNGKRVAERITSDRYSGEEYVLSWKNRVDQNTPVKKSLKSMLTRYTGIIDTPVTMPTNILYFGAGDNWADIVTQLKVAGSTMADPLHLLIDGDSDGPNYAWVKEIVSISSIPEVPGEGDHGIIFLRNGGRVGLGNHRWNSDSLKSWKLLGKDYLTISPAGNGTIDLNSDVYVVDKGAFVAESNFGENEVNRLTINLNGNTLYIPAGKELDLSSFGQNLYRQEIEFAGEGRVVLGHGSVIRFPNSITPSSPEDAPVLYFNDNTKLIIEDDPEFGKGRYTTLSGADEDKVKIFGVGQIWLNKDARFEVMGSSKVRVGSDVDTYYTWIRLSIQRQGDWVIGDEQERGGSFEVGNISEVTGHASEEASVNFELILNGMKARAHLDRGAFLGFGVGVIDKSNDNMNGDSTLDQNPVVDENTGDVNFSPDTVNAWKVQTLYDVNQVKVYINKGIFDHSNIFNGSNRISSMLAIGPLYEYDGSAGSYTFELTDPDRSKVLGGGNLMLLDQGTSTFLNAWDFADSQPRENWQTPAEDYGMYNILASDMIIQQQKDSNFSTSTVTKFDGGGIRMVTSGSTPERDLFDFISTPKYTTLDTKLVSCGKTEYRTYVGYVNTAQSSNNYSAVNTNQIYRKTGISLVGYGSLEDGAEIGVLGSTGTYEPVVYTVVNRR